MEQLSSGVESDLGNYVAPSSSSGDQSFVRSSTDATISSPQGEQECLQCHTLQQKIDSLKKQDEVYQTLKQKIVKTDTLIKKYVSKQQECEELQKKNEDLAHKYSLLMKNYKALENQLGNTVKELLPWKLDKDRYVGEVTELRNKVEETEVNLSASEVLCKQLKEMIVSNEAQEEEYKCTITKLKGDIQQAVQKYKAESHKVKKATKHSLTLKQKSAETDQREGRLRKVLRKMQKIMLDKGLVPPEIPENVCDQGGIVKGDDSDLELMDESDDEEPTWKVDEVVTEEAEKSSPSENVINIHDHADNQSVSGESDCIAEDAFSDFADEIDAQLGNDDTSDKGTPDKVSSAASRSVQEEKRTENAPPENAPPTENAPENVRSTMKKLKVSSPVKTGLSCNRREGSITVLGKNRQRKRSNGSGDDGKKVKPENTEKENAVVSMDTSSILNCLDITECLSDGNDKNDEEEVGQPAEKFAAGYKEMVGKDGVGGRRRRSRRSNKGKEKEEGDSDDEMREDSASQEESNSKSSHKRLLFRRAEVISSSLSDSSSGEDAEELKEKERNKGEVNGKRRSMDEGEKMRIREDSTFDGELNQSKTGVNINNDIVNESTEIIKKSNVSNDVLCSQEEEKLVDDLEKDVRVEQNVKKEVNLEDKLEDKGDVSFSNEIEIPENHDPKEKIDNCSSSGQSSENVTENKILDENREIAKNGNEDGRQQDNEKDVILLQSPRRVTRGMLKSLQDTKVLKDTNGNHLKQQDGDEETKQRDAGIEESTSSRLKSLVGGMKELCERIENVVEGNGELGRQSDDKKSLSLEEVEEEGNLEASLFDIEDVGNENVDEEMDGTPEKRVLENEDRKGEGRRISSDEKDLMSGIDGDSSVTVKSDRVLQGQQNQKEVENNEKVLTSHAKSSEEMDRLANDDSTAVDGRGSVSGQRMTRSKMKSVHVKEEFSGKRVTRLKAKMMPEVAEYLEVGDDCLSGKNLKQRGTRRNNNRPKNSPKSVEFLNTSESEDDGGVAKTGKWKSSPSRRNLKKGVNGNEKDNSTVFSCVVKEEKNRSNIDENIRDDDVGTSPPENASDKKTDQVEETEKDKDGNGIVSGVSKSIQEKCSDKRLKQKRNVSFLERKENIESEEVSVSGVFVKKEVLSCKDDKSDPKMGDVDGRTQSTEGKGIERNIGKDRKLGMGILHNIKTEPDDNKQVDVSNAGDTLGGKRKKSANGTKSKRKRSETKDKELKTSSCRRVAFESDGEEERKEKSAAVSPKSTKVKGGHPKKSESPKVGTFKDVIHEAERYRSGSELSDSLSSPKSAGFSPSRETPFGFEKPKLVLQTSKPLSSQETLDRDLRLSHKEVIDDASDGMGKGKRTVAMGTSESQRNIDNGQICKSSIQKVKGISQRQKEEQRHEQRNLQTVRFVVDQFSQSSDSKDRSETFPSELPFENLMNLDRVSPIPVSPRQATEEPSLEPMIASILDSLPLITRMLSPIPGSPLRDDLENGEDGEEWQQTLSPLSPSDSVSFLPPFTNTDTSRPLSPLPHTPVPVEDTPEVVSDEPCDQRSSDRGESGVALPMNFHAVVPAGVIAVKPQMGTSFRSARNSNQSDTSNAGQTLVPRPGYFADTKEKGVGNSTHRGGHNSTSQKGGDESKSGFNETQNDLQSENDKEGKTRLEASGEGHDQTKKRGGGNVEEQLGTGDGKLKHLVQMDKEPIPQDDTTNESNEGSVLQEMKSGDHSDDGQVKQYKREDKVCLRAGSDADSLKIESVSSCDDQIGESNRNKKDNVEGKNDKTDDEFKDGDIADNEDDNEEGIGSFGRKNDSLTVVPQAGSTKEDGSLSSSSVSGENRRKILQFSNKKQWFSKDIDQEDKKAISNRNVLGKGNVQQGQENEDTKKEIKSEKSSSSGLKRDDSLGFTCNKDSDESESPSDASSTSPSKVNLKLSQKTERKQEGNKERMKFGGGASLKIDAKKQDFKENESLANEHKRRGDRITDNASNLPTNPDHETVEDDFADFVDYNINTRERPKADPSIPQASKAKVAQIWGNIAEKSKEDDIICKRKNFGEHAKLKKQKINKGSRLVNDSELSSNEEIVLDELIQEIHKTTEETQYTVQKIIQYVKRNNFDLLATVMIKVQRKDSSMDPVITSDEEKLIAAISQRDKKEDDEDKLAPQLLICLSTLILHEKTRKKDPRDHAKKITYCRMLAAFCRLEGDAMMLRVLCYDLVKKKINRWEELMVCIASVWSAALTKRENQSMQPMISVLEFLTWQRLKSPDKKQNTSDVLWQVLEFMCQWREPSVKEEDKFIQTLTENMKDCETIKFSNQMTSTSPLEHPSFEIVKAIELLAWSKGWQWTWAVVIQSYIWPALGGLCQELSLGQTQKASCICCCLKVLGNLGIVGLKDEQNQGVFDLIKMVAEILRQSNETIPPIVQVYAVQTILNLAPIQPFFANECLQKWIQDHKDIQLIRNEKHRVDALAKFVKSYQKPRNLACQKPRTQGKPKNYNRMPPPQDFSSRKPGGPRRGGPSRGGPSRGGPSRGGPSRGGPSRGGPSRGGPSRGGPSRGGPSRGGPSRGGPSRGGPSRGGPSRGGKRPQFGL